MSLNVIEKLGHIQINQETSTCSKPITLWAQIDEDIIFRYISMQNSNVIEVLVCWFGDTLGE